MRLRSFAKCCGGAGQAASLPMRWHGGIRPQYHMRRSLAGCATRSTRTGELMRMSALHLYNTLTRRKQPFEPAEANTVRMYTCGPTVYDVVHVGNLRTFLFYDVLRRALQYKGFQMKHVMNITDVDDKTINAALQAGVPLPEYTAKYTEVFLADLEPMRVEQPEHLVRATEHIPQMVELTKTLLEKGHAYESGGSVYFNVASFPGYGKLSGKRPGTLSVSETHARIESDEYKDDVADFALWKAAKPDEPTWDSPWGPGRPGWFIECSVMAMTHLGETIDIHSGGTDLIFPHHENEIAQSEAATGKPFARFWVHPGFLLLNGQKISKSLGNIIVLKELLDDGHDPAAIRLALIATAHYRTQFNFTVESVKDAARGLGRIHDFMDRLEEALAAASADTEAAEESSLTAALAEAERNFDAAIDDDLNLPQALSHVFDLMRGANSAMADATAARSELEQTRALMRKFDRIFAVFEHEKGTVDAEIEAKIRERDEARKERDFARADQIRDELASAGIVLEDGPMGTRWRRVGSRPA